MTQQPDPAVPERLMAAWRHLLETVEAVQVDLATTSVSTGLDDRAIAVLERLAGERDRSLTTTCLGEHLQLSDEELARSVDLLEAQGRVRRADSRSELGVVHVVLTPAGLEAAHRLGALHRREVMMRLARLLGEDGVRLLAALSDLLTEPHDPDAPT